MSSINNGDLNGARAINNQMPMPLALIAFSSSTILEKFPLSVVVSVVQFRALVLNIIPIWLWMGIGARPMGLGRWGDQDIGAL